MSTFRIKPSWLYSGYSTKNGRNSQTKSSLFLHCLILTIIFREKRSERIIAHILATRKVLQNITQAFRHNLTRDWSLERWKNGHMLHMICIFTLLFHLTQNQLSSAVPGLPFILFFWANQNLAMRICPFVGPDSGPIEAPLVLSKWRF